MKVVLTRRVRDHLDGSGLWQHSGRPDYSSDPVKQAAAESFVAKVDQSFLRADGSVAVHLEESEIEVLRGYVEGMEIGGRDNAWDPDGRGDLLAARALLRKIGRR